VNIHNFLTLSNTTVTELTPSSNHSGIDLTIQNVNTSGYLYVGGANVSSTNYGYRISPNHAISFEIGARGRMYIIASSNGLNAAVINIGLE
jgi:hypothetical protein